MIDTHAHLNFQQFSQDLPEVLANAAQNSIDTFINIGADLTTTKESIKLAKKYPQIYLTVGIHPTSAEEWNGEVEKFFDNELKTNEKVVGVGEIGLDYFRCKPQGPHHSIPKKTHSQIQQETFRAQLQLAKTHQKPIVIHSRNCQGTTWKDSSSATAEIWQILQEENYPKCVFHCFAEDLEFAQKLWEQGIYISFNGTLTYPNAKHLQIVAKACPKELFLLETDCPFLPPQSKRGQRNEPAYIKIFAETLAAIRQVPLEQIAEQSTQNSKNFFNIQ